MLPKPKAGMFFDPSAVPLSLPDFVRDTRRTPYGAVRLDRRARMLYDNVSLYLYGEVLGAVADHPAHATLADRRRLAAVECLPKTTLRLLHEAYLTGTLHVGSSSES